MIHHHIDITNYNTFKVSQQATALFEFNQNSELVNFLKEQASKFKKLMPVGQGSNLLFTQKFDGCLLKSQNSQIEIVEEAPEKVFVKTGAGVEWDKFVEWAVERGFYGIENLSLIPGTTGASPVQNIGAYGVEVKDCIEQVEAVNLQTQQIHFFSNAECRFGYRDSIFKNELRNQLMVTSVFYRLSKKEKYHLDYGTVKQEVDRIGKLNLKNIRQAIVNIRNSKLPDHNVIGNAGSFFKNPVVARENAEELHEQFPEMPMYPADKGKVKIAAGWLIDQCGFKGYVTSNGAGVHEKQALVLVNKGTRNGSDIIELANKIKRTVSKNFGIQLEPEVTIL